MHKTQFIWSILSFRISSPLIAVRKTNVDKIQNVRPIALILRSKDSS